MKMLTAAALALTTTITTATTVADVSYVMEARTSTIVFNPIVGYDKHGGAVPLGLLGVCAPMGDPYGHALFYGRVTMHCGSPQEVYLK